MKIVHINTAQGIDTLFKSLPTIMSGMEKVIGTSPYSNTFAEEINALLAGQHQLWIAFDENGAYQGFATTCIEKGYANIVWAYGKPGNNMIKECLSFFEGEAKRVNLKGVMFYTARDKGFEKATRELGYKPVITQFVKEVV